MSLQEYKKKRNFRKTHEPAGNGAAPRSRLFVVQKHAARRLHYDFRLEIDGVLKSWAVPKGPSLDPSVKSLAVHVEDHPLEYASFEGVIPQGEYGGGTVMVWDQGTWEPLGDAQKNYHHGKLKFRLMGEKLHGNWSLVRMSGDAGDGGKNWLLMKHRDEDASESEDVLKEQPLSVLSGRDLQEIAKDADRVWTTNGKYSDKKGKAPRKRTTSSTTTLSARSLARVPGAQKSPLPRSMKPQLAALAAKVPTGDDWLHELKFDGYRLLTFIDHKKVRLITRNGNDWTARFRGVATALSKLPVESAVLDGEIVALDVQGLSNFQQLQNALKTGKDIELVLFLFDAPYLEGYDLTATPLSQRKELLERLLLGAPSGKGGLIRYSDHIQGQGRDVYEHACRYAMEGVISKQTDSKYEQRRSSSWLKSKCLKRQEFVIGGYTWPSGSRVGFGALLLGYYDNNLLSYAGRVGTGFTDTTLRTLCAELKARRVDSAPFAQPPTGAQARGVTWVRPELVAEVEFTEWTEDGLLRHPSFQGLREDKQPRQIIREVATPIGKPKQKSMSKSRSISKTGSAASKSSDAAVAGVRISNPDRVLYPEMGLTKLELAQFYEDINDWILPYVSNRPLTMVRCPRGRSSDCFYQKHMTDALPDTLRGVMIQEKHKLSEYVVVDDLPGLVSLVQMGVLELHPWGATADQPDQPDQIVFDLDPGPGASWSQVVAAARDVRDRMHRQKLQSFVRTSGGKGLHVVIPLAIGPSWDDVKAFAKSTADQMAKAEPAAYVASSSKEKRKGKVFVDYLRNSRGATSVANYSTRARPGAPVAVPLRWDELKGIKAANQYTVANLRRRLAALKDNPWKDFCQLQQSL